MKNIIDAIKREVNLLGKRINIMEFCGGHTHVIVKEGIDQLLEPYINFIHGPGCPVCVLPIKRVELAIKLARLPDVILVCYGDMIRVPGSNGLTLREVRGEGCNVEMVYSCYETLTIANMNPDKKVIFFAIGFETTTPPTGILIKKAKEMNLKNLFIVSNHVLTPSALQHILETEEKVKIDGIIGPGHVSTIIGTKPYAPFAEKYNIPIVISGFEPEDVLESVYLIIKQIKRQKGKVINQYKCTVKEEGNKKALEVINDIFEKREEFEWRGLGVLPESGLKIKEEYSEFDAEEIFNIEISDYKEPEGCICGDIIRGVKKPFDCPLFGKVCNPDTPVGACMVSSEGACAAYYKYKYAIQTGNTI